VILRLAVRILGVLAKGEVRSKKYLRSQTGTWYTRTEFDAELGELLGARFITQQRKAPDRRKYTYTITAMGLDALAMHNNGRRLYPFC